MTFNILFSIPAGITMAVPLQAILFLGIIPALILLYIALKGYEGYYKDKTIFITFILGIILGIIAAIVRHVIWYPLVVTSIIIFAFFEQLLKTIFLNLGRFQRKKETPIYGLSMGLGFGSSFTPFLIIQASTIAGNDLLFLTMIAIGSLGFIFFHAATTTYIGYGVYTGRLTKYLLIAILIQIPFNIFVDLASLYGKQNYAYYSFYKYFQIMLVIYGGIIFYYVIKKILPGIKIQKIINKKPKKLETNN
jgi:hypothetical protein